MPKLERIAAMCKLVLRSRELVTDENGFADWQIKSEKAVLTPSETAVIIVDMWDKHWCTGATIRGAEIAERMDVVIRRAREMGMLIVHAPSDTMDFYKNSEACKRLMAIPIMKHIPTVREIPDYPQPVDASDAGSDTQAIDKYTPNMRVWERQTDKIDIDESRDIIGDNGDMIYSYLHDMGIRNIIYMGVHTNMCILNRPFAIKAMLRRGMNVILCRDLTDAMYNPAKAPYVSHSEGTRLVIEYIEKFYCATVVSNEIS